MPSLLNTYVASNYNRMVPQDTYGYGALFTNFGTRKLRFISITAVTGNTGSTSAVSFADTNASYTSSGWTTTGALTAFDVAVRALQTGAEVYLIGTPGSAGFLAAIAEDTVADNAVGSHTPTNLNSTNETYGQLEATILASLQGGVDGNGTSPFATGTGAAVTVTTLTIGNGNGITIA
jgi:hypothetical protein